MLDTLLAGLDTGSLQEYLHCLIDTASKYGLEPNWDKTHHMKIQHEGEVLTPNGDSIKALRKQSILDRSLL